MKLLLLGNSYLATFSRSKQASKHETHFAGFSASFDDRLEDYNDGEGLMLRENSPPMQKHLWKLTTGTEGPIIFSDYHAFVVVGLLDAPNPWTMVNCQLIDCEQVECLSVSAPVSYSLYKKITPYKRAGLAAARLASIITKRSAARTVFFVPVPHVRDDAHEFDSGFAPPAPWATLSDWHKQLLQLNEKKLYLEYFTSLGVVPILPPSHLVVNGNRCPAKFSNGALGSNNFVPDTCPQWGSSPKETEHNYTHKNIEYGKAYWHVIDRAVESGRGS